MVHAVKPCIKCGLSERGGGNNCLNCARIRARNKRAAIKLAADANKNCPRCNAFNWTKGGHCRECIMIGRRNLAGTPCKKCGGERSKWGGCLPCKRACERRRNGVVGATGESGVGKICAICKTVLGARRYALDHNHSTGAVRGWLCVPCNAGIGNFREDPRLMRLAAMYIEYFANPVVT